MGFRKALYKWRYGGLADKAYTTLRQLKRPERELKHLIDAYRDAGEEHVKRAIEVLRDIHLETHPVSIYNLSVYRKRDPEAFEAAVRVVKMHGFSALPSDIGKLAFLYRTPAWHNLANAIKTMDKEKDRIGWNVRNLVIFMDGSLYIKKQFK
ncbi:MAG: hypothetical protein J7K68_00640 [Candidatus Diapherotrites archaeon]|nr:hypothetical protein [Candidatus Diapherotrites archaeon]